MTDRSRIRVKVGSIEYPDFKAALRANKALDRTRSNQRTEFRKQLRAGGSVLVFGIKYEPI